MDNKTVGFWWRLVLVFALVNFCSPDLLAIPNVTFTPSSGTIPIEVTLEAGGNGNTIIYYTLDGSLPDTSSSVYSGPISLTEPTIITAMAYLPADEENEAQESDHTWASYDYPQLPAVAYNPADGLLPAEVTLSVADNADATIYYTLDGTEPDLDSEVYSSPIVLTTATVIKAFAIKDGFYDSEVSTISFDFPQLPGVVFDPDGGIAPQVVTLSVPAHSGATIYYTLDGTTPNTGSSVFSGTIAVTSATTIKALATESGYLDSSVTSASFSAHPTIAVALSSPATTDIFTPSTNISLLATATVAQPYSIIRVEMYAGSNLIGTVSGQPYSLVWSNVAAGNYTLTARAVDSAGVTNVSSAVNIEVNNNPLATIAATDSSATEGGSDTGIFTVYRTGSTNSSLTVFYTVGGTATAGSDYQTLPGSVTIPAGSDRATITVTPVDDSVYEPTETVVVTLYKTNDYRVPIPQQATVYILDNELPPLLVDAGTNRMAILTNYFTLRATCSLSGSVRYDAFDGSYPAEGVSVLWSKVSGPGWVNFAHTNLLATEVSFSTRGTYVLRLTVSDAVQTAYDDVEVFAGVTSDLNPASDPTTPSPTLVNHPPVARGDILIRQATENGNGTWFYLTSDGLASVLTANDSDGDGDELTVIHIGEYSVTSQEEITNETFDYTISDGHGHEVTAPVRVYYNKPADSWGQSPPVGHNDTVELTGGEITIDVLANDEKGYWTNGTLWVVYTTEPKTGTVTINSDRTITYVPGPGFNGSDSFMYAISSDGMSFGAATVTINGPTIPGPEPTVVNNDEAWLSGGVVEIDVLANDTVDAEAQLTIVQVTQPTFGTVSQNWWGTLSYARGTNFIFDVDYFLYKVVDSFGNSFWGKVTVHGDVNLGAVSVVTTSPGAIAETGETNGVFTVYRWGDLSEDLTVAYAAGGTATSGTDYEALSGSVVIPAGETSAAVLVVPVDDLIYEPTESVTVVLSDAGEAWLARPAAGLVITDDEPVVTIVATTATVSENGGTNGVFTVTRTGRTDRDLTVHYSAGGTATAGADYVSLSGTVVITTNESSATILVTPIDDSNSEYNETVSITLTADIHYGMGALTNAVMTIVDDELPPLIVNAGSDQTVQFTNFATLRAYAALNGSVAYISGMSTAGVGAHWTKVSGAGTVTFEHAESLSTEASFSARGSYVLRLTATDAEKSAFDDVAVVVGTGSDSAVNPDVPAAAAASLPPMPREDILIGLRKDGGVAEGGTWRGYSYEFPTNGAARLLANDYDPDGDALSLPEGWSQTQHGLLKFPELTWVLSTYLAYERDSAAYYVSDVHGNLTASQVLMLFNDGSGNATAPPTAIDDTGAIVDNVAVIDVLANDQHSEAVYVTDVTQPLFGTATLNPDNTITYVPGPGFPGSDSFMYAIRNSSRAQTYMGGTYAAATVTVTGEGTFPSALEQPVLNDDTADLVGASVVIDPLANDTAGSAGPLTIVEVTEPTFGHVTINDDGTLTYVRDANKIFAVDYFLYKVSGGHGFSGWGKVAVNGDLNITVVNVLAATATVSEAGGTNGVFTVYRWGNTNEDLTILYTLSGSASNGSDYETLGGSVVIPAGSVSATINVTPIDDLLFEGNETVIITLAGGNGVITGNATAQMVITDDEPVVSLIATTGTVSESGGTNGAFTVYRTGRTDRELTVYYSTGGTATAGVDYTTLPGSIVIPTNQSSAIIYVAPIDDLIFETNETVTVNLSVNEHYGLATNYSGIVTIMDDEPSVSLSVTTPTISEGGGTNGVFTVFRTGRTNCDLTVYYSVGGSAIGGSDYTELSGSVVFGTNQSSATILISPIVDTLFEFDETVVLTLTTNAHYQLGTPTSGVVTITDDEPERTVTITASEPTARESDLHAGEFTVQRTGATNEALTVYYAAAGTATAGSDYTSLPGSVTIPAGSAVATIVVTPIDDNIWEGNETVVVTLTPHQESYRLGSPIQAKVTIVDDEALIGVVATDSVGSERGTNTATIVFYRNNRTNENVTVNYTIGGTATADVDYVALSGTVMIPAGSWHAPVTVTPLDDELYQGPVTVVVTFDSASDSHYLAAASSSASVTIIDKKEDFLLNVDFGTASTEMAGFVGEFSPWGELFGVRTNDFWNSYATNQVGPLLAADGSATTVSMSSTGLVGTATNTGANVMWRTYSFGETNGTSQITVSGLPAGYYAVSLYGIDNHAVGFDGGEVTAENPELIISPSDWLNSGLGGGPIVAISGLQLYTPFYQVPVEPALTISAGTNIDIGAGRFKVVFMITRTGVVDNEVTVFYSVGGTAVAGTDYEPVSGQVKIPAGQASATVEIVMLTSLSHADFKTVALTLAGNDDPSGSASAVLDAPQVYFTLIDGTASESGDTGVVRITRTGPTTDALEVLLEYAGSATYGVDFNAPMSAQIPAGSNHVDVTLVPILDAETEDNETAEFHFRPDRNYSVASPSSATVVIANVDTEVRVVGTDASMDELGNAVPGGFTITRTGFLGNDLEINFQIFNRTGDSMRRAIKDVDFSLSPDAPFDGSTSIGSIVIPAGESSAVVIVTPLNNSTWKRNRELIMNLGVTSWTYWIPNSPGTERWKMVHSDSGQRYIIPSSYLSATVGLPDDGNAPSPLTVTVSPRDIVLGSGQRSASLQAIVGGGEGNVTYFWSQVRYPDSDHGGRLSFTTPADNSTVVGFSRGPGTYTVRVKVTDGDQYAFDFARVTVVDSYDYSNPTPTPPLPPPPPPAEIDPTTLPPGLVPPPPGGMLSGIVLKSGNTGFGERDTAYVFPGDRGNEFMNLQTVAWENAYTVEPYSLFSVIPGTQWITVTNTIFNVDHPGESIHFRRQFVLPPDFHSATLGVVFYADNAASVLLNGVEFGRQVDEEIDDNLRGRSSHFAVLGDQHFVAGTNTLEFIVHNFTGYMGLDYLATINFAQGVINTNGNRPPTVFAGFDTYILSPDTSLVLEGQVADDGLPSGSPVVMWWEKVYAPPGATVTFDDVTRTNTLASFSAPGLYRLRLWATDSEFTSAADVTLVVVPNEAPRVFAGNAQTIIMPDLLQLDGQVSDPDHLPVGATVVAEWSVVSGPPTGTPKFNVTTLPDALVEFDEPGEYLLRLTATDGDKTSYSDVTITVRRNEAPVVDAGTNQVIVLPTNTVLHGSVTDDGLPLNAPVTYGWEVVDGPGQVIFGSRSALVTTVAFSAPGDYVLRLWADDTEYVSESLVTITVYPKNLAPVVYAGTSLSVKLTAGAELEGTADDDGWPAGSTLTTLWTKVSGPGTVTFDDETMTNTLVAFSEIGQYILRLTATDGQLTNSSQVLVRVRPDNDPPVAVADVLKVEGNSSDPLVDLESRRLGVLDNDSDPEGTDLTVIALTAAAHGTVAIIEDGAAVGYTPARGFVGIDTFTYAVSDAPGATNGAVVTVFVNEAGNHDPVATDDNVTVIVGHSLEINVLANDSDEDDPAQTLVIAQVTQPPNGWVTITNSGAGLLYLADTNYLGDDQFTYTVTDGHGGMATATVTVTVESGLTVKALIADLTNYTILREGLYTLSGAAYSVDTNVAVNYQLLLYLPDGTLSTNSLVANLTPGPRDTNGFHAGPVMPTNSLGELNLTAVPNGIYDLVLKAKSTNQTAVAEVRIILDTNLRLGQFTFSEQDLSIPVAGIPLTVTRTYDSQNAKAGAFGYGWTHVFGGGLEFDEERETVTDLDGDDFSLRTGGGRNVIVTLPGGQRAVFTFNLRYTPNFYYLAEWAPVSGAYGTLRPTVDNKLMTLPQLPPWWQAGDSSIPMDNYDFPGYILTTVDGTEYYYEREDLGGHFLLDNDGNSTYAQAYGKAQLTKIVRPTGDTILVTPDRFQHYDPDGLPTRALAMTRDGDGHITEVYDPNSFNALGQPAGYPVLKYEYANGNLVAAKKLIDRSTNAYYTTTYSYTNVNFPHYITKITDPRGYSVLRNLYDTNGLLVGTMDAAGYTNGIIHDLANHKETLINRLGYVTQHYFDTRGNITNTIDALGNSTTNWYDADNNLVCTMDPLGHGTWYGYDGVGNRTSKTDALNLTTSYDCVMGRKSAVTDPRNQRTESQFDGNGNGIGIINAQGNGPTHIIDSFGRVAKAVDVTGQFTGYGYNAMGDLASYTNEIGSVSRYLHDDNGNTIMEIVVSASENNTSVTTTNRTTYDTLGRQILMIDEYGNTNQTSYNAAGKIERVIGDIEEAAQYVYDARGYLQETISSEGSITNTYDAEGQLLVSISPTGQTTFTYDPIGRLTLISYPDGTTASTEFDGAGRKITVVDRNGHEFHYGYDAIGRRTSITNALGAVSYVYDDSNNLNWSSERPGVWTEYDELNRPISVSQGQLSAGGAGTTRYDYDSQGRLIAVTNALECVTRYIYDQSTGDLTEHVDANGRTNLYEYIQHRRIKRTLPGGQFETYAYNAAGLLTNKMDFRGTNTTYYYDSDGRLTNKVSGSESVLFTYTNGNLRASMTDASGNSTYAYDSNGRLSHKTVTFTGAGFSASLYYAYDSQGNLTNISSSTGGTWLKYGYDRQNRLMTVTNGSAVTEYSYDGPGNLQSCAYPNGVVTSWQFDNLNRLTNIESIKASTSLARYSYKLATMGLRTNVTELNGRTVNYAYDPLGRLTNETVSGASPGPDGTVSYTYDAVGNRLSRTSTLGPVGQSSDTFDANDWSSSDTHDANGNTLTEGDVYDFENRLISRTNGPIVIKYDGDGHRISKTVGGVTTYYLVDDLNPTGYAQVLEELTPDANGELAVVRSYAYGHDLISQTFPQTTSTFYYGYDGHGSVRYLTDTNGIVTDTYDYDAFGILVDASAVDPDHPTPNDYLYAGEQFDSDLGMYFVRARYFSSEVGRFWTMDPYEGNTGDPSSLHKYLYCANDPINRIDPSGLMSATEVLSAQSIQGIINTGVGAINTTYRIYNTVNNIVDLLEYASLAAEFAESLAEPSIAGVQAALIEQLRRRFGTTEIANLVKSFDTVFRELGSNWPAIADAIRAKSGDIAEDAAMAMATGAKKIVASGGRFEPVFQLPTGPPGAGKKHSSDRIVKVGKANFGIGTYGGRLFGFGFVTNTHRNPKGEVQSVFRIDYWDVRTQLEGRPTPTPLHVHYHIGHDQEKHPEKRSIWP